jgi:hypothetical protein
MRDSKAVKERPAKKGDEDTAALKRPTLVPVFGFEDYRSYLHGVIEANPEWRAFKKQLAEAAGCTQSFLAQVLSESASFSFDHLHGIATFLGLGPAEWAYLRELVVVEKCATPATRADATRRAEEIRLSHGAGVVAATPAVSFDVRGIRETMFSLLHWDVFHVLGAPGEGTPERLAARFNVARERVVRVLKDWEQVGLVEKGADGQWRCKAVRFKTEATMRNSIAAMYKMRAITRAFEGRSEPAFAAIRLRKPYVQELSKKVEELFEEAWRLAALSEADGDHCVFLSVDFDQV